MKKTILTVALLSLSITAFAEGNVSLFSITPSILQATLRSDSKTSVQYTLTNNSANTLRGITLPIWPAGISTQSIFNTCSSVLAAHTTCHFNILIQGRNQPSILSLRPTICINNGGFCGRPDANQILTITTLPITDHAYAYLPILNNNQSYSNNMVSANTTTPYRLNTPYTNDFDFTSNGPNAGGIAVSKDGHYAYVVDRGNEAVKILSLTQGQMTLVGTLSFSNTDNLQSIVVNPAGTRAYVSAGTTVYAINVSDKSSPQLLEHNDTMTIDSQTFSMAISPDG
ncbi:MAG: hypothetical protein NTV32_06110, partial [Gammaproteobacteria bacterium]|nr:hypothetical protein [Gammaproteobacteria bacterium]